MQPFGVLHVVGVARLRIQRQRQRGRAVRVNGAEEQLRRLELTGVQDGLAQGFSRSVVKAKTLDRNQHQVVTLLLKHQGAGREGIMNTPRQLLAAFIARQHDRKGGGDVDARRAGAERMFLRDRQAYGQKQPAGTEKEV